jgi:hypothetical protein
LPSKMPWPTSSTTGRSGLWRRAGARSTFNHRPGRENRAASERSFNPSEIASQKTNEMKALAAISPRPPVLTALNVRGMGSSSSRSLVVTASLASRSPRSIFRSGSAHVLGRRHSVVELPSVSWNRATPATIDSTWIAPNALQFRLQRARKCRRILADLLRNLRR